MQEPLARGIFVEEAGATCLGGVVANVTAMIGLTHTGPVGQVSDLFTSFADFERVYGGAEDFVSAEPRTAFLAHAVVSYFMEGGERLRVVRVGSCNENSLPGREDWEGALSALESADDISLVAAPGASALDETTREAVAHALIAHAERLGAQRFAVLDAPPHADPGGVHAFRAQFDSANAALHYPWVVTIGAQPGLLLPPAGYVCGIYARAARDRGLFRSPATELIRTPVRLPRVLRSHELASLTFAGISTLRFVRGRGNVLWSARTMSSEPEWKYAHLRRYFIHLEHSLERGTQWVVFERNCEVLWTHVRDSIADFLLAEWRNGALVGSRPEEAFFVKCDRSTMTQSDLESGRLICLVGVALLRPAEFVIVRIGQWTAGPCE